MNSALKRLRPFAPRALEDLWRRRKVAAIRRGNVGKSAREIFSSIYLGNRWGGEPGRFHSGNGSSAEHAQLYAAAVRSFIHRHGIRRVVDLGCGDFQVGARVVSPEIDYVGIDIVEELIEHNRRVYGSTNVSFRTLDIIEDPVPDGELCLLRQVLQHLSNEQIQKVLRNLRGYRYVLVTEHYPAPESFTRPNVDKPCGEDVRIYDGSAVYLDLPPFNQTISASLLDVDVGPGLVRPGERIRTFVLAGPQ